MFFKKINASEMIAKELYKKPIHFDKEVRIRDQEYSIRLYDYSYGGMMLDVFNSSNIKVFYVNYHFYDNVFQLHRFYALNNNQGKGIGSYMIKHSINIARKYNFNKFEIHARASSVSGMDQKQLVEFYRKQDYKGLELILNE